MQMIVYQNAFLKSLQFILGNINIYDICITSYRCHKYFNSFSVNLVYAYQGFKEQQLLLFNVQAEKEMECLIGIF